MSSRRLLAPKTGLHLGKYSKLVDAKVLLRCALFIDVLTEAKNFSLKTQKSDINIIDVVEAIESTKLNYQHLLKLLREDPESVFKLPTLKLFINHVESNEDEDREPRYQEVKLNYYLCEKSYIANMVEIVESIVGCFSKRYVNTVSEASKASVNIHVD